MAALPPLSKTWQMSGSHGPTLCVPVIAGNVGWAVTLFPLLTYFANNPWVIDGSSNGATGAMDGANRWLATTDIILNSWLVIRQPATGQSLCYQNVGGGTVDGVVTYSPRFPFTGGSASTRPTSIEESSFTVTGLFHLNTENGFSPRTACVWHANDGLQTMVVLHGIFAGGDALCLTQYMGNAHNAAKGWDFPNIIRISTATGRGPTAHDLIGSGAGFRTLAMSPLAAGGAITASFSFGCEGVDDGIILDPINNNIGLYGSDNLRDAEGFAAYARAGAGATLWQGTMGCWPDLISFGRTSAEATAAGGNGNFPDASKSRIEIGALIYPWDGATVWVS